MEDTKQQKVAIPDTTLIMSKLNDLEKDGLRLRCWLEQHSFWKTQKNEFRSIIDNDMKEEMKRQKHV